MAEGSLVFPQAEFQRRTEDLQLQMARRGVQALLLTMPPDVFYVTGFLTRFWGSPARPWYVVVPAKDAPVAVIPSIGAPLMGRTWIADMRTWDAPDPKDDGIGLLTETLCSLVPGTGKIGVPMGLETQLRMPLRDYEKLRDALTPRLFVDATSIVQRVREIKSEAEIDKLRDISMRVGRAFDQVPAMARAGQPLADVFRDFQIACLSEGADWVSYLAGGSGPDGYDDVIAPAGPQPLSVGDVLMLDTGAVRDGYFCDFDRNFAIGPASDQAKRSYSALWQATEEALGALRPGQRACDLHRTLWGALERLGASPCGGRLGHGLGLSLTEWPSLTPLDQTPLRAGMVLTIEPSVETRSGRIMVHEENIVLREDGPELLNPRAPPEIPEILQ